MKNKVYIEVRLNKNIIRFPYNIKTIYKKELVIEKFTEKEFNKLNEKNIDKYFSPQICEGMGVYEYFNIEDIKFIRIEKIIKIKEKIIKLNKK